MQFKKTTVHKIASGVRGLYSQTKDQYYQVYASTRFHVHGVYMYYFLDQIDTVVVV